uniref:Uncharacterized protein n=1 Tax=Vespula pensylvanica TaxID=30213 RepID=A0A834KCX3_VESPE|nr:hypothetical protein H0235_014924 [Vespula pensylvanica]
MDPHTQQTPCGGIRKSSILKELSLKSLKNKEDINNYRERSSGAHHAEDERSLSARVTGCIRRRPMSETSKSVRD